MYLNSIAGNFLKDKIANTRVYSSYLLGLREIFSKTNYVPFPVYVMKTSFNQFQLKKCTRFAPASPLNFFLETLTISIYHFLLAGKQKKGKQVAPISVICS